MEEDKGEESKTEPVTALPAPTKSAEDILDELFTSLGSKDSTESLTEFLKSPKKKKKHKEKKDKKKAKKKKSKEKDANSEADEDSKKRVKSLKHKSADADEDNIPLKKKRKDSKSEKTVECPEETDHHKKHKKSKHKEDLEDGEIKERKSRSKKRHSSEHSDRLSSHHSRDETVSHDERHRTDNYSESRADGHDGRHQHPRTHSRDERAYPESSRYAEREKDFLPPTRSYDPGYLKGFDRSDFERDERCFDHDKNDRRNYTAYDNGRRLDRESDQNYGIKNHGNFRRDRTPPSFIGSRQAPPRRFDDRRRSSSGYDSDSNRGRYSGLSSSRRRTRSRSPHSKSGVDVIDKVKLLEIARRNASILMKKGVLPTDIFSRDQIMAIKAGGKSVEELTNYCRRLARKDGKDEGDPNDSDDGGDAQSHFVHHPFVVKERAMPQITLNIRNAIPLPVRTPQALAIENAVRKSQFPVSSGCQHRFKELEWKQVEPEDSEKNKEKKKTEAPASKPVGAIVPIAQASSIHATHEVVPEEVTCEAEKVKAETGISLEPPDLPHVDIGSVISARLRAMRKLKDDPDSEDARKEMEGALQEMEQWTQVKALEPKFLTVSDLQSGPQAWAKRDQLKNAKEVASGMGMHLLQKMGWRPGEGLGKNKEGSTEPLSLDIKTDKKGLAATADVKIKNPQPLTMLTDLSGKHPVSALMELCTKRRWGPPSFDLCFEHGPAHQKSFVFKVTVNGVEYQPCIATNNKKLAKANAAAFCLQSLGLLKVAPQTPVPTETLQTVTGPSTTTVPTPVPPPVPPPGGPGPYQSAAAHFLQAVLPNHPT